MLAFPAARKRLRDETVDEIAGESFRRTLASRVDGKTPTFWRRATLAAGVTGTDAFLVHLGQSITAAMQSVSDSAEAARAQLRDARSALHAAIDTRCDELGAIIDSAEIAKAASLERELVAVDAALEFWRNDSAVVSSSLDALSDTDLASQYAALSTRLDGMEAMLQALPTTVKTPLLIKLACTASLMPSIAGFGIVINPLLVTASDLHLERIPGCPGVRLGTTLCMRLSLGPRFKSCSAEELELSLTTILGIIRVDATLEGPGIEPHSLEVALVPDASHHCVVVTLAIPLANYSGQSVYIAAVHVGDDFVLGTPVCLSVLSSGSLSPFVLKSFVSGDCITPCISQHGFVYCPPGSGDDIRVCTAEGTRLPNIPISGVGLSAGTMSAAFVNSETPSLLLADLHGVVASHLVAVDPVTFAVRWTSADGAFTSGCKGIATLPSLGVVIVSGLGSLFAHRLSDGFRVGSLKVYGLSYFLASDPATGTVYGNVSDKGTISTHSWRCSSDADGMGVKITSDHAGHIEAAATSGTIRPLAVVPPAPGKRNSHLVVGIGGTLKLLVLALPDLVLVHTHTLDFPVLGLAADPWGEVLAVCEVSDLHVLAWPLPGMSPLE